MMRFFILTSLAAALIGCSGDGTTADGAIRSELDPSDPGARPEASNAQGTTNPVVMTNRGAVRGKIDRGVPTFLGIPFAKPPVGSRRFKAPEPLDANWEGVRDATEGASACLQLLPQKGTFGSEDCLYLNVFTPPNATAGAKKRVMYWLFGGGFTIGAGDQDLVFDGTGNLYHGATFAKEQDVVVVTMNYRVGELGFTAHPALSAEDPHGSSGNYGTLDQIAGLQWVRDNIANFGGDPNQVTIFGESAGAVSVGHLLVSPLAAGLFHAAIMESGGIGVAPRARRYAQGQDVVTREGCAGAKDVPACLRHVPGFHFLNPLGNGLAITELFLKGVREGRMWQLWYGPNVDDYAFTSDDPYKIMREGKHNKVPLIVGNNSDEAALVPLLGADLVSYEAALDLVAGPFAADAKKMYPYFNPFPNGRRAIIDAGTDIIFGCDERRVARNAIKGGSSAVYRYVWTHGYRAPHVLSLLDGAFHAAEFPIVWNTTDAFLYSQTSAERLLGTRARSYWTNLITGNPNTASAPAWPKYDLETEKTMILDTTVTTRSKHRDSFCNYWDQALNQE
ncbi:carboxylesterase/lipase family protein [Pendulispora albinea]|uniref:Carboxylic ester hydrolase n=1 Tax=Pendulispora albinea TaxID=2741071 RepID=A0ABZ2M2S8_9BACT